MTRPAPLRRCLLWLMLWLVSAAAVVGQEPVAQTGPPVSNADLAELTVPAGAVADGPDYAAWAETAARAEAMAESGRGSSFALGQMRNELVGWRDVFLQAQSVNSARIGTVQGQLDALGSPPAEGALPEDDRVIARRAALQAQMAQLKAPAALSNEAYAHASGLVSEIDVLLRSLQASKLLARGQSPLDPTLWPTAIKAVTARLVGGWKELMTSLGSDVRHQTLAGTWPETLLLLLAAVVLLTRSRYWMDRLADMAIARHLRSVEVLRFLFSLAKIALPLLGIYALSWGLNQSGLFGYRATQIINAMPKAGMFVLVTNWLSGQFFGPNVTNPAPFDFSPEQKAAPRRLVIQIGWVLAMNVILMAFISTGDVDASVRTVVMLPLEIMLALVFFRFGRIMVRLGATAAESGIASDPLFLRRRLIVLGGRLAMAASVIAPFLSMLGFSAAGQAVLYPMILTHSLLALVLLLQWLVYDIYGIFVRSEKDSHEALLPVLVGFVLLIVALPFLSLIWGARVDDLNEIWTRFRGGYAFGETRISPIDFATFLLIFVVGYTLTRLVQGALKTTVLPKTSLDIGGQNAIVSGLGYVGIFLSAVLAITSTGLDLSNLAIVAGALSVGIGFGLQTIVSNFVSGIILLIERPISEGDWIEVGGRMGYVRDISVRSTRIETFDRTDVIVPNADLVSGQVVNWTRGNSVGRVIVPVSVMFGTDTEKVAAILHQVAEAHPLVLLSPPPSIILVNFGADALNFEIRAIVRDVNFGLSVRSEMNHIIAKRFFDEGIELAGGPRPNAAPGRTALTPVPRPPEPEIWVMDVPSSVIDNTG